MNPNHIRNVAVIAHVDHGKTTLVDAMLKQTNVFRDNQEEMNQERILDRNDLERERGITILAKICAISYKDIKINIIDTPGHADFSGEVERTLGMADGALLIIDAQEGPMPQTRFVLKLALSLGLKIIVVINKIDKKLANPQAVLSRIEDLFLELAHNESHLSFPVLYGVGRQGKVFTSLPKNIDEPGTVLPLLDTIINEVPAPQSNVEGDLQLLVSSLDYDAHLGRLIIGKIHRGILTEGQKVIRVGANKQSTASVVSKVMLSDGLTRVQVKEAYAGDLVTVAGIDQATIGDTISLPGATEELATPLVSEPTLHLTLGPNTSPFSGKEAQYSTSRQIGERLKRELENNVSLRVDFLDNGKFKIAGRGELHLSILLETMRREGYEMEVGKPEVIRKMIDGQMQEPVEEMDVLVPKEYTGVINQEFGKRLAQMTKMEPISDTEVEFVFTLPTRATIGLRSLLLTLTKGTVLLNSQLTGYEPVGADLPKLRKGALVSDTAGRASEYGLRNVKGRGMSFIQPGANVYEGMIIGINAKDEDISMNICKEKNLTNHRTKSHQGITQLAPDIDMSLEQSLDFLEPDELLEITPESIRLRKKVLQEENRLKSEHHTNR